MPGEPRSTAKISALASLVHTHAKPVDVEKTGCDKSHSHGIVAISLPKQQIQSGDFALTTLLRLFRSGKFESARLNDAKLKKVSFTVLDGTVFNGILLT